MKQEIFNGLEQLFKEDGSVEVFRDVNSIIFRQLFADSLTVTTNGPEKNNKEFTHTVTLLNDNLYETLDVIRTRNLTLGNMTADMRKGHLNEKGFMYGLGKDNINCKAGIVRNEWSTEYIKAPVREYLSKMGLKEKAPFWTGKKLALFFGLGWGIVILIAIILLIIFL